MEKNEISRTSVLDNKQTEQDFVTTTEQNSIDEKVEKKYIKKEKIRDISVDLIRVIACLIVIATHLTLTTYNVYEVQVDWSRLFTKCFLSDGVGIFFLITGFFISNGRSYKKILKNTVKNVILPAFILLVFSDFFSKFIVNQDTFINCIKNISSSNLKRIVSCICQGDVSDIQVAAHLWYIFAYIQIIILFPLIKLLCTDSKESKLARRLLMLLCFANILIRDIQKFFVSSIGNIEIFSIIDEKILAVFLGYELYLLKDKIKSNKKIGIIGFIIFIAINVIRYRAEMQYMIMNHIVKEEAFNSWKNTFGFISAVSLFIAIYSINIKNQKLSKFITNISSLTYGIYLVHYMLIAKIDIYKFEKISTFKFEMLYMLLGTLFIFIVSGLIVYVIRIIKSLKNKIFE